MLNCDTHAGNMRTAIAGLSDDMNTIEKQRPRLFRPRGVMGRIEASVELGLAG